MLADPDRRQLGREDWQQIWTPWQIPWPPHRSFLQFVEQNPQPACKGTSESLVDPRSRAHQDLQDWFLIAKFKCIIEAKIICTLHILAKTLANSAVELAASLLDTLKQYTYYYLVEKKGKFILLFRHKFHLKEMHRHLPIIISQNLQSSIIAKPELKVPKTKVP